MPKQSLNADIPAEIKEIERRLEAINDLIQQGRTLKQSGDGGLDLTIRSLRRLRRSLTNRLKIYKRAGEYS